MLDREGHYCSECLEKANKYNRETRRFCREHHICTECRKEIVYGDDKVCFECRAKINDRRKPLTDEQKKRYGEKFKKQQKSMYQQRSEQGICTRCGKRKAATGRKKCAMCLEEDAYMHRKQRMNRPNAKDYRKENHLCYFCGKPIDLPIGKICSACMEKCKESGKKSINNNDFWKQDNNIVFIKARNRV